MDTTFTLGKTSQIEGSFGFPNISFRSEENMEVDDDRQNDMMKTKNGRTIDFIEASRFEERMEVKDANCSTLKKPQTNCKEKMRRNLRDHKVLPDPDDDDMVVDIRNRKTDVEARETSAERTRRNLREHGERRVVPDLDDYDMVVDIRKEKQGLSKKVVEASEFDPSQSEVVELTIKGKFHKMEPTEQSWSGAHSTCTVLTDIDDKNFKIAHKFATAIDVNACRILENTDIPPKVYHSIERKDNKIQMFMELIFPSVTLDVITKHMLLLSKKTSAKTFVDGLTNDLVRAVVIMHSKGVSHGDLHAGNMLLQMVNQSLILRIIDFEKASGNMNATQILNDFSMISTVISNLRLACKKMGDRFPQDDRIVILKTEDAKRLIEDTDRNAAIYRRDQAALVQLLIASLLEREQQFPGTSKG